MKTHLVTYGNSKYKTQREFFKESALASSFFDEVKVFTQEDLDPRFVEKFGKILEQAKGGGYWIWKPYLIKMVLDKIEDNDILIYCDAGCMINSFGKERFDEYINQLINSKTGVLSFQLSLKEHEYTKKEVFDYFKSSEEIINSGQLIATIFLLKKCDRAVNLVNAWYNTLWADAALFTDQKILPQYEGFIDHRHDQSIFSVLLKTHGAEIIPDETYFYDFLRQGHRFPFWATRL